MNVSESQLQKQVLAHLTQLVPHAFFWRSNTGAAKTASGFVRFGLPGQSDVMGCANGLMIAIELKTERGRQSAEQKAFQHRIEAAGGRYVLARTLDEALAPVIAVLGR